MASEIWQELMGIEPIGVDDNFFELGGHSLLGIQVLGRMNDAFAVRLSFQDLFAAPTVAGLSAKIAELSFEHGPDYAKIASLLDNLEQHSEEEIRKIVAESRAGGFRK
jgi:acyl carrier protein